MQNVISWLIAFAVVLVSANPTGAVFTVASPVGGATYLATSNIAASGARNAAANVKVQLVIKVAGIEPAIGADSGVLAANQLPVWSNNFAAPTDGWTVSDNWQAWLYEVDAAGVILGAGGGPKASAKYKVISP